MLQSKLKINRTTWGLPVPYRRPSHQPPLSPISFFTPFINIIYIYYVVTHVRAPLLRSSELLSRPQPCLFKTGTSILCRFCFCFFLGGGLHQRQAAGAWQLAGWQFGVSSLFMAQVRGGHSWEVGRKGRRGTAWVADNGGQKPRSGLREDRTAELQGVSI